MKMPENSQTTQLPEYRNSQKHESTLLHTYVLNEFLTADRSCATKYFWKTLIEVGSSHIYASFCTFCVQIGQLFEAQWVFERCMKTVKSLFSKENDVDFEFFRKFKISLRLEWCTDLALFAIVDSFFLAMF